MPRKLDFGRSKVVIVPVGLVLQADREVEAQGPDVFIAYPDNTSGTELAMIIKEAASVITAVDGLDDEG